jgi:hypothetical protein
MKPLWLKVGLPGISLLLAVYGVLARGSQAEGWQKAGDVVPPNLLVQVKQENLSPDASVNFGQMKAWKVQYPGQPEPLYLIDSRLEDSTHSSLCGAAGCAVFAYTGSKGSYQQVFAAYLNPYLPPEQTLIQPASVLENGLPQLLIRQWEAPYLQQFTLTFNGQKYEVMQVEYLSHGHE